MKKNMPIEEPILIHIDTIWRTRILLAEHIVIYLLIKLHIVIYMNKITIITEM